MFVLRRSQFLLRHSEFLHGKR